LIDHDIQVIDGAFDRHCLEATAM